MGKNSANDFHWIISNFDADSGESETGFSTESIYTASADGTSRNLYGTKYSGPEPVRITVIKQGGADWTITDNRLALKWLTGAKSDSWLDLYIGDEVRYRMLGHVQNVLQYKMDARIVGLVIVFESASPFAFSSLQTVSHSIAGKGTFSIDNPSDDMYTFVKMKTTYQNTQGSSVTITNTTFDDYSTQINNLAKNEIVTLHTNQSIVSDKQYRMFGNDFNYWFPRLGPGVNEFTVIGTGNITFEYSYFIKIGDMATEINAVSDRICDDFGNIQLDMLDWSRISNTPTTAGEYGITDVYTVSAVYNKNEIDSQMDNLKNIVDNTASLISTVASNLSDNHYTKDDVDKKFYNKTEIQSDYYNKTEVDKIANSLGDNIQSNASVISTVASSLTNNYYTKTDIDNQYYDKTEIGDVTYTKKEVDKKIKDLDFRVKSNASLISTISSDLSEDYYNKANIDDNYYNKTQIDRIVSVLTYDPSVGVGSSVMWSQIIDKPTTLSEYGVKSEVQDLISSSIIDVRVDIDEAELNAMLSELLEN